jgi:glycosyltransferase involved in cell wall biosynthesis
MSSTEPLISVIIPTRERAETLRYALETALDQSSQNFEVIVSDNFSQDNTAKVVKSFEDPRVRLINPGRRLSMCDNWDFALLHARGEYVTFIGDDDGFLPRAIDRLESVLQTKSSQVYSWPIPVYKWPADSAPSRVAQLPVVSQPFEFDLEKLAKFVVSMGGWRYSAIPSMYHSAVARGITDTIRRTTGRVFHSTCPDVFMCLAVPAFAKKAINVGFHVTVQGHSQRSNGGIGAAKKNHVYFQRFLTEYGDYKIHPTLYTGVSVGHNLIPDAVLVAMDRFPQFYEGMKFNYEAMWAHICRVNSVCFKEKLGKWDVIRKRKEIRRFHPFSPARFLFCSAVLDMASLYRWVFPKTDRASPLVQEAPDNIRDFVKELYRLQHAAHGACRN